MNYLSLCDGIGAAHVAWKPLGWSCVGASEIERFPIAVVKERHPEIAELGDMTRYHDWNIQQPDLICGGTPCQSFSVAGLRKGLADPRGNLALVFLGAVDHFRPRWVVWENVPGVLSSGERRDFGSFLGGLGQLGYGFAHRVLDAQYFGLAQRRKRVFVVGCLGDWRGPAAVLFERHSLQGHPAPGRGKGEGTAATVSASPPSRRNGGSDPAAGHFDASEDGTGRGVPLVMSTGQANAEVVSDGSPSLTCNHEAPIMIRMREGKEGWGKGPLLSEDQSLTLATANDQVLAFRAGESQQDTLHHADGIMSTLPAGSNRNGGSYTKTVAGMQVRRLTPAECEKLQGFPPGYTDIPWRGKDHAPDGPRYKALGNSWAVPVVRWIGERIAQVDAITHQKE